MNPRVNINLSTSEAIVFFDFLARNNEKDSLPIFEDSSERTVLNTVECILEKELAVLFDRDYKRVVQKARETLNKS